jgi:hypothetical protein
MLVREDTCITNHELSFMGKEMTTMIASSSTDFDHNYYGWLTSQQPALSGSQVGLKLYDGYFQQYDNPLCNSVKHDASKFTNWYAYSYASEPRATAVAGFAGVAFVPYANSSFAFGALELSVASPPPPAQEEDHFPILTAVATTVVAVPGAVVGAGVTVLGWVGVFWKNLLCLAVWPVSGLLPLHVQEYCGSAPPGSTAAH